MHRSPSKRRKVTTTFIIMLLVTTLVASLLPRATATPSPVKIDSIDPTSGPVGTTVRVIGEIDTTNGSYRILFDGEEVTNGTVVGTAVNDTFRVPLSVKGNHNVTLYDVTNSTQSLPVTFNVTTSYYVLAEPARIQEGLNTTITVSINEAEANTTYPLTINVTDPQSTPGIYTATLDVSTDATGSGSNSILYYGDFSAGANTNYVGTYTIAVIGVNETLTTGNFTVGLTDKLEYRRIDNVLIRGSGYNATESVTVDIATSGVSVIDYPKNVTAGTDGIVTHVWSIPDNATLGNYTVTLTNATSPGTFKPDVQNFSIVFMERILLNTSIGGWRTPVRVIGEISTLGGQYRILWDSGSVKAGNCGLNSGVVNDTFIVPYSVKGYHNITLYDVNQTTESMPATFEVTTSCYVLAEPVRILEGLYTTITVGVRDAEANVTYTFTMNITDPLNRNWTANVLVMTDEDGSGENSTRYPGGFVGADTNYLGIYSIAVNATLATGSFTVGLTDALEYRKTNRVIIQGSGYEEEEIVTVNITYAETGVSYFSENRSVIDGIVAYLWTIPESAPLGIYTVTLSYVNGTFKPQKPDIQNFTVIEIIVYCQAQNKYDKEPLPDVTIDAIYLGGGTVASGKTNKTGWIDFRINRGNYTFKAIWKGETVGTLENQSVTGNATEYLVQKVFNITCELAHITIAINDEADPPNPLPLINVTLTSNNTGALQFETDYTGIITTNTFTNTSYTIETRRHGYLFNRTLIENLTVTRWINITCPTYTLFAHVLDSQELPLQNVQVAVYEWSSELLTGSRTTNDLGSVAISCTFGRYKIRVYDLESRIILNETVINLIKDQLFFVIHCRIYNVDLSIVVKDYFGNPISNALVKIERENVDIPPQKTGSNGKTSFEDIIGGEVRISVSVKGKLCETRTIYLDETKAVVFKLDKYVMVAGYPLETTQFIACISLGMLVAFFALALIYRRFRTRKVSEGKEKTL